MATFSASDVVSTTLEAAFLELASRLQQGELVTSQNPEAYNGIQIIYDTDNQTATVNAVVQIKLEVDPTSGRPTFVADEYLTDAP